MKSIFTRTLLLTLLLVAIHGFCQAQTKRYVDSSMAVSGNGSSWATAFKDFQAAIDASGVNDTVLVAKGTYQRGSGSYFDIGYYDYNFQKAGLKIFGGFPSGGSSFAQRNVLNNPTVLKGNNAPVLLMGAIGNTEFDGFTIRDGVATLFDNDQVVLKAGGLVIQSSSGNGYQNSARIIKNCSFVNNTGNFGGAVFTNMFANEGTPTVFANCLFNSNTALKGGAIYHNNYSLNLYNCSFYNNKSTIPNLSVYGGYCIWNVSFTGGISAYNCIFDNEVWDERNVIGIQFAHLENCIYPRTYTLGNSWINVDNYNFIYPRSIDPDNGNRYVDPANGNFHLQCSSNANNNGNNAKVPAYLTKDLAGNDRIRRTTVDMGVFEEIGGNQYTNFYDTICQGSSYIYKGQTLTQTGAYSNTYSTYYGCDSIVTLYLKVLPATSSEVTVITCGGYTANGITYTTPDTYVSHTTNMYGCDSTITVHLLKVIPPSATLYVDSSVTVNGDGSSWANAFQSLADALLAAKYCSTIDSILVAKGTYQPPIGQSFVMAKGVKMFGGFPSGGGLFSQRVLPSIAGSTEGGTILTGNGAGIIRNDNNLLTPDDVLDGFTFRDGYAESNGSSIGVSAGIANIRASPTISHCSFLNNFTASDNGGGAIYNNQSSPIISQCIFWGNTAVETVYPYNSGYSFGGYGGGISSENSSYPVVSNSLFIGNAASLPDPYDPTYYDGGGEGGAIYSGYSSSIKISNCVFANNKAGYTGAVASFYDVNAAIYNSILYNNSAGNDPSSSASLYAAGGAVVLNNSIVGPGDHSYINQSGADINGTGDLINTNPLFVNPANNDYRLLPNSPAIDAGTADTTGTGVGNVDLWNSVRIKGSRIDMGVYELPAYYSNGNNLANTLTNWRANTDGTGASPAAFNNLARFTVQSGHTLSATGNLGLDSSALIIQSNAGINNTGILNIGSLLSNNGTISGSGTTVLNGTMGSQTLEGIGSISSLTINNNATIAATGKQTVTDVLTLQSGTLITNGNLVLASTAVGTASIAAIDGTINTGTISGNLSQQRYIPAKGSRTWSLVASPFAQTISSSWQQQVHITGAGTGGTVCPSLTPNSNGFDATVTNAPSMYVYDGTKAVGSRWTSVTGTTAVSLAPGTGYRMNIRGPRSMGCSLLDGTVLATAAATLSSTGALSAANKNMGSFSTTVSNNGDATGANDNYLLIGNPYPSPISFSALRTANSSVINNSYAIYAPGNTIGNYAFWNGSTWTGGNTGLSDASGDILANGQAFFVKGSVAGANITLNWAESMKSSSIQNGYFRNSGINPNRLRIGYFLTNGSKADEIMVEFTDRASSNEINDGDVVSISTGSQNLKSLKAGKELAFHTRSIHFTMDTVQLNVASTSNGTFKLSFYDFDEFVTNNNAKIYLIDKYTGTTQLMNDTQEYSFTVNNGDANSFGKQRLFVVFIKPVPVSIPMYVEVRAYPNPVLGELKVQLPIGTWLLKLSDAQGKVLVQQDASSSLETINMSRLSAGTYLLEAINQKGGKSIQKIIKQ